MVPWLALINSRRPRPASVVTVFRQPSKFKAIDFKEKMQTETDEVSLSDVIGKLWDRRLLITLITSVVTAIAVTVAFALPEKFESSVVMAVVASDSDAGKLGGAGALLSQFGSLAGLSGLGGGASGKRSEAIATLQSSALTEAFIRERELLPLLFPRKWDADSKRWKDNDADDVPTVWKGELKFRKDVRTIVEDKKSGLVTLTITWTDAVLAAQWADELVKRTNAYLRQRAIEESDRNLAYLNEQASKTSVVELQKAIYALTEAEIKKIMLAKGSDEYAFRVIDPARIAEVRSSPKRLMLSITGVFIGLVLSIALGLSLPVKNNSL